MSIADKLITIANNTPLVCANLSTTETAKGNPITVGDVSDIEHNLGLRVTSKNLIPFPYLQSTKELNGITVIVNDNGTISASGTATADTTIYFDLCVKDFGTTNMYSGFAYDNGYAVKDCTYDAGNKKTYISISVKNGEEINNTYYPQIELGSTVTPYTPYRTEFEGVEVSRYGKNLFDINSYTNKMYVDISKFNVGDNISISTENNYNFKIANTSGATPLWQETKVNKSTITLTQTLKDCGKLFIVNRTTWIAETKDNLISQQVQLELGSTVTEYEPYKEPQTATANSDGTVEGLTSVSPNMTLLADNSVSIECSYKSGGNPTANEKFIELQEAFANAKEVIRNYIGGGQDVMA